MTNIKNKIFHCDCKNKEDQNITCWYAQVPNVQGNILRLPVYYCETCDKDNLDFEDSPEYLEQITEKTTTEKLDLIKIQQIDFLDDCLRIQTFIRTVFGFDISLMEVQDLWGYYSDNEFDAGWIVLPDSDTELGEILHKYIDFG